MSNSSMRVTLTLDNRVSFIDSSYKILNLAKPVSSIQSADEIKQTALEQILEALTVEECREIIANSVRTVDVELVTLYMLVKKVIDEFDLYALFPGIDAPYSEYDLESRAISEKIQHGMSDKDIAVVIKDVFDYYFDAHYNVNVYMEPAKQIHSYINQYL